MTKPTGYAKEYIGITKKELYGKDSNISRPEKVVAICASREKINSTVSLLSIVNNFSAEQKIAKGEPEAIQEAKVVLSKQEERTPIGENMTFK